MKQIKHCIVVILSLMVFGLYLPVNAYATENIEDIEIQIRLTREKPILPSEPGWISKYKWWLVGGGIVLVSAAVFAVGKSDDSDPEPPTTGGYEFTW